MADSKALPTQEDILKSDYSKVSKKLEEKNVKIDVDYESTIKKTKSSNTSDITSDEWAKDYWTNVGKSIKKEFLEAEAWKTFGKSVLNDLLSVANTAATNFLNNLRKSATSWLFGGSDIPSVEDLRKSLDKGVKIGSRQAHHIEDIISAGDEGSKGRVYYLDNIKDSEERFEFFREDIKQKELELKAIPGSEEYQDTVKDKEGIEQHNKSEKDWSQIGVVGKKGTGFEHLDSILDDWLKTSKSGPSSETTWKHADKHWDFDEKSPQGFIKTRISNGTLDSVEVFKAGDEKLKNQLKNGQDYSWTNDLTMNASDKAGDMFATIMVDASFEKTHDFNVHLANETSDFLKQLSLSLRGVQFGSKLKWKSTSLKVGGKDLEVAVSSQQSPEKKGELTLFERPDMRFFKWAIKNIGLTNDNLDLAPSKSFDMIVYRPTVGAKKGLESYKFESVKLYDISGIEGNNSKDLIKYSVKFIYRNVTKTTN